jgi:alpha-ketoglutarate-dependent taurine dioxygenase
VIDIPELRRAEAPKGFVTLRDEHKATDAALLQF